MDKGCTDKKPCEIKGKTNQLISNDLRRFALFIGGVLFAVALYGCDDGSDGSSGTNSPVAQNDGPFTVNNGEILTVNGNGVLDNDTDADGDTLTATVMSNPSNGTLALNTDGSFSYTHSGNGQPDSFTYKASDGNQESNVAEVTIDVNEAPIADAGEDSSVTPNGTGSLDGSGSSDPNPSDSLSYLWKQTGGNPVSLSSETSATTSFTAPGTRQVLAFELTVTDQGGLTSMATVSVEVNTVPTASNACINESFSDDLTNYVTDPDDTQFGFSLVSNPSKGSVSLDSATGQFTYTPDAGATGTDTFTYQVDDLSGGTDTAEITMIVNSTRIMPLGDSITAGKDGSSQPLEELVGYRRKLYDDLTNEGFRVDFVGGLAFGNQASPPIPDPDHEGHSGIRDCEVVPEVFNWLVTSVADIVLLHIGTNNVRDNGGQAACGGDIGTNSNDVRDILDEIDQWEAANNSTTVFLAQIINRKQNSGDNIEDPHPGVVTFNDNLATLVNNRPSDDIELVDMFNELTSAGDFSDDGTPHPNATGYNKMANKWLNEIRAWQSNNSAKMPKCP